jgi:hypothetical protein
MKYEIKNMAKGRSIFQMDKYELMNMPLSAESIKEIETPFDKSDIKQRDGGGGKKLNYVDGPTVIEKLNKAFGYKWSFEILSKEIIKSEPKIIKKDGQEIVIPQSPYVEVVGRLTVPGVGVKEQFGTKILVGGASEQEGAAKSAATDALKKCATLLGIGLELYGDSENEEQQKPANTNSNYRTGNGTYKSYTPTKPQQEQKTTSVKFKPDDIRRMKELKAILGITDNKMLDPYVKEFTGNVDATYKDITPMNIGSFNKFLEKKAEFI